MDTMMWKRHARNATLSGIALVLTNLIAPAMAQVGSSAVSPSATTQPSLRTQIETGKHAEPKEPSATQPTTQPSWIDRAGRWADKVKNPVPWFKWGHDYRLRWEYLHDAFTHNPRTPDSDWSWQRSRPRVWFTLTPVPEVEFNVRFAWESRHFCLPRSRDSFECQQGVFDIMNVKVKPPGTPATFTIGRQEIIFGDGWLVLDGTPLDGSATLYFDAARMTLDLKDIKTTVDAIAIGQTARTNHWLPPINDVGFVYTEQNEIGAIAYVSNKSIDKTTLDGYFIYRNEDKVLVNGDNADIYTFGGRALRDWTTHIQTRVESAGQFGHKNGQALCASGLNSRATYFFRDAWNDQLRLSYEFLSGDDPATKSTNEAFDPLWGRWPQWSEMFGYTLVTETRAFQMTNLQRLSFGGQTEPTKKLTIAGDYHLLWANENTYAGRAGFSDDGLFRGQLLTGIIRYKFNRFLTGHIIGEYMWTGDYYARNARADMAYFRMELFYTF
jgi:hypothetical protein